LFKNSVRKSIAKSFIREISYFPHPFSGKQHQNLFTMEILLLQTIKLVFKSLAALKKSFDPLDATYIFGSFEQV